MNAPQPEKRGPGGPGGRPAPIRDFEVTDHGSGIFEITAPPMRFKQYLVVGEEKALLIDTGFGIYSLKEKVRGITELPVTVVNTHAHPDHMGLCRTLQDRGAVIAMPAFEAACVDTAEHLKAWYPLFSIGQIRHYFASILFRADLPFDPAAGTLELSGAAFTVLHAPGPGVSADPGRGVVSGRRPHQPPGL